MPTDYVGTRIGHLLFYCLERWRQNEWIPIARVDPLPHQLEAVYGYFLRLPRIRFLLADDPAPARPSWPG